MTLLSYISYDTKTVYEALDYFRTFAISCGWTVDEWRTNCSWGVAWAAGTDSFLEISSNGYGTQHLKARLLATSDVAGGDDVWIWKMVDPHNLNYATGISDHPVWQDGVLPDALDARSATPSTSTASIISVPTSIPSVYFFGNGRFLAGHFKVMDDRCFNFAFGLPDLYIDYASGWYTDLVYGWAGQKFYGTTSPKIWSESLLSTLYAYGWTYNASVGYIAHYNSTAPSTSVINLGTTCAASPADWDDLTNIHVGFKYMGAKNGFADDDRVLLKNLIWFTEGGLWYCMGELPAYICNSSGAAIGELISKGSEEYRVFPAAGTGAGSVGIAYRVT